MDRRTGPRQRTIYRPAFVRAKDLLDFVVMRNVSPEGACFTGSRDIPVGQCVTYLVGDDQPIEAEVVWKDHDSFGVKNLHIVSDENKEQTRPYRSVRVPIDMTVKIYVDGFETQGILRNLSQRGACVECGGLLKSGQLVTIKVGNLSITAATVAWSNAGRSGIRFPEALDRKTVSSVLGQLHSSRTSQSQPNPMNKPDRSTPGSRPVAIAS